MNVYRYFAVRPLSALLALVTLVNNPAWSVQTMMPGQYQMVVRINKNELREQNITFMLLEDDP
ncbi:hypothetical protein, partial [Serratia symbiotica]